MKIVDNSVNDVNYNTNAAFEINSNGKTKILAVLDSLNNTRTKKITREPIQKWKYIVIISLIVVIIFATSMFFITIPLVIKIICYILCVIPIIIFISFFIHALFKSK